MQCPQFEPVIGLEVHAQLKTSSKAFCSCPVVSDAPPNSVVCPVCLGLPGALPVVNKRMVESAVKIALALKCQVNTTSQFERKNYFYPDLPKGYQITQFRNPIAENGALEVWQSEDKRLRVKISRIQLEEDSGACVHQLDEKVSTVDFNRCGVPLVEIVTAPDMHSADEAVEFLKELQAVLRFLQVSDADMDKGAFRCDVNISIRPAGSFELWDRSELKNLNSYKSVRRAIQYEILRQIELAKRGARPQRETRSYEPTTGRTVRLRTKESLEDYRYFPEPNLPPLKITDDWIDLIAASQPRLPCDMLRCFLQEYKIPFQDAKLFSRDPSIASYVEAVLKLAQDSTDMAAKWLRQEYLSLLHDEQNKTEQIPISPQEFVGLLELIERGKLSNLAAKQIFRRMWKHKLSLDQAVAEQGQQINDEEKLMNVCKQVLTENPQEVYRYQRGKESLLQWFIGEAMKRTKGRGNPKKIKEILHILLKKEP